MGAALYMTSETVPRRAETVLVADGDDGHRLARPGVVSAGYPSISAMLASSPFFVAHRGGSEDWDEMTMRAYTNSVAWGAGALEVSVARTSDGFYFGLHDEYLDRTSLGTETTTLNPKTMTWAQVQQYDVFGRQPYMLLDDLAAAYGDSHVFLIDPKYIDRSNSTSRNHFFNAVKTMFPEWEDRVVIKLFWGFNSDWGAAAKSAGFTTWGYLWDDDGFSQITGNPANHANFDWLGLNHDAAAGAWTTVLNLGKPVIGHVCPSEAAASSALSKGASGIMAAGVRSIITPKGPWS